MKGIKFFFLSALLLCFNTAPAFAADGDEAIEEIVVTGSYLKRSAQDSPSPLSVITSADIEDIGAQDMSEIVATLPWQSGSQTQATTFGGEGADGQNSINLRNMGHGATLPLVNGKRQVASWYNARANASVNVNNLVPNIALERIEIVKDGASALYGSDAMAGVVNFITKKDFEGFDVSYEFSTDDETTEGDTNNFQAIWGIQGDRGGVVVSAGSLNRDEITIGDRYDRFGGSSASSTGQPGRFQPVAGQDIVWAANGVDPGASITVLDAAGNQRPPRRADGSSFGQADVDCEVAAAVEEGGPLGLVGPDICAYDFGSFFALQAEESLRKFHVTGHYDVSDNFEAYFEFAASDSEFDRQNSLNPNALNLTIDGQIAAAGQPAQHFGNIEDAFRRGIEPISVLNRTRLVGGTADSNAAPRPISTFTDISRADQRMIVGGVWDLEFGDRSWTLDLSYTATEHDSSVSQVQDTLSTEMNLAINGLGGPGCDPINGTPGEGNLAYAASGGDFLAGNCYFFNPFGNANFARDGSQQTDLTLVNPVELYEWLLGRVTNDIEYRERVLEGVLAGEIFDTDSGPIGLAVGFQRRRNNATVIYDAATNTNNLDFAFGAQDWEGELTTTAYFLEVAIPLGDMLEVNLAGRYEDFDEIGESTTDPKVTILFRPIDDLSIRASYGSSFRVASLQQLFGTRTDVANMVDLSDSAFRPFISEGNINLEPETTETYNIGFSWVPSDGALEGFQIDVDYYDIEYEDIITREDFSTILAADNAALNAAIAGGQTLQDAIAAGVGNRRQVVRNGEGALLRVLPDFINAGGADIAGLDLTTSYSFDSDIGNWRVGLQASWAMEFDTETPDGNGGILEQDAVGQYNLRNAIARPLPEFKANLTLNWAYENHRAFMLVRWIDSYEFPAEEWNAAQGFWGVTVALANGASARNAFLTEKIDSWTTVDLQYTYTLPEIDWLQSSSVTVGIKNVLDEEPPWVPDNTGWDTITHDFRGRLFSVRFNASL